LVIVHVKKIKRLQHSEMTGEIDYSVEIEHYRGPKKRKMTAAKVYQL